MSKIFNALNPIKTVGNLLAPPSVAPPPPPPAPPVVPTIDNARQAAMAADALAARKGRAASILTGNQGDLTAPPTSGAKQLLGG